jgi:hypothetical protein
MLIATAWSPWSSSPCCCCCCCCAAAAAVLAPLWINSERIDKTTIRPSDVQAVAEDWASEAGWSVIGVTATGDRVLVDATGPNPDGAPADGLSSAGRAAPGRPGRKSDSAAGPHNRALASYDGFQCSARFIPATSG